MVRSRFTVAEKEALASHPGANGGLQFSLRGSRIPDHVFIR
jgi:hypothetical protein